MKILHTADLHLGKRVDEFSMIEDQRYILARVLDLVKSQRPDAVVLAGDIYDKSQASNEAVELFDDFLVKLGETGTEVFVLAGNHDSAERIAFGGRLMRENIHLSPLYNGEVTAVTLRDEFGPVDFYMLPFVKPAHVRRWFPEETIESYTDAVGTAIAHMRVDPSRRNVLITHQFVTGAARSDSEERPVGGLDNVAVSVFDGFDYVALGHIHGPQSMGEDRVRYAGSPLKYSFSEASHHKSVSLAELEEKGKLTVTPLPLVPLHDLVELRGPYELLTSRPFLERDGHGEDYVHIILTDEEDVPDAIGKLRRFYTRLLKLDYDNTRTRRAARVEELEAVEELDPLDIFGRLYETQNNQPMSEDQRRLAAGLIGRIWGGEGA